MLKLFLEKISSPFGELSIITDAEDNLRAVEWDAYEERLHKLFTRHYGANKYELIEYTDKKPSGAAHALTAYFKGDLNAIASLKTKTGGTAFQKQVWAALRTIPIGKTLTYGDLAKQIGKPKAVRAVGLANGANPIGIVVPCHRVIGANGKLTGYAGGVDKKHWLLEHEGAIPASLPL